VYMEKGIARKQHRKAWTGNTLLFVDVITSDRYTLMKMIDSLGGEVRDFRLIRSDTPRTLLQVHIVAQRLDALRSSSSVIAVSPTEPGEEIRSNYLERIDSSWNIYDFGPLLVPGKGTTIELNDSTYTIYGETIDKYEGVVIKKIGNIFMCASKAIEHYTFQNDYYFLMGDNRGDSHDSRHYGMVPMQGIEGKVDCILYSTSGDRIEFTRLFKPL
jgi:signal peptidase I